MLSLQAEMHLLASTLLVRLLILITLLLSILSAKQQVVIALLQTLNRMSTSILGYLNPMIHQLVNQVKFFLSG